MPLYQVNGNDTDTPGQIVRASYIYTEGLPARLRDLGFTVYETMERLPRDLEDWYFNAAGVAVRRPVMPIVVGKTVIRADEKDEALLSGIPKGAQITINGDGPHVLNDGRLSLVANVPSKYSVHMRLWPYQDFLIEIEAVLA